MKRKGRISELVRFEHQPMLRLVSKYSIIHVFFIDLLRDLIFSFFFSAAWNVHVQHRLESPPQFQPIRVTQRDTFGRHKIFPVTPMCFPRAFHQPPSSEPSYALACVRVPPPHICRPRCLDFVDLHRSTTKITAARLHHLDHPNQSRLHLLLLQLEMRRPHQALLVLESFTRTPQ